MIIDRFGATYATAYELPILKGKQKFTTTRQPVTAAVSGTSGAYVFSPVAGGFPINPVTVSLQADLKGTSFSNVDTVLNTFILNTIAYSEVDASPYKLWGTLRDETTHVWAWAYPVKYDRGEEAGNYYTCLPVTLDFYLPEGVWYAESLTETSDSSAPFIIALTTTNLGNYLSVPTSASFVAKYACNYAAIRNTYHRTTSNAAKYELIWEQDNAIYPDMVQQRLSINCIDYEITQNRTIAGAVAVDAYAGNTVTYNRMPWLAFSPHGTNKFEIAALGYGSAITGATNATPIVITVEDANTLAGLANGDSVIVSGIEGNTAANGVWQVANIAGATFELSGSVGNGTYTASTGKWNYGNTITSLQNTSGTLVTVIFDKPHGLVSPGDVGNYVSIVGVSVDDFAISDTVDGVIFIDRMWPINTIPSANSITIDVDGTGVTTMTAGLVILTGDEFVLFTPDDDPFNTITIDYYKTYIF